MVNLEIIIRILFYIIEDISFFNAVKIIELKENMEFYFRNTTDLPTILFAGGILKIKGRSTPVSTTLYDSLIDKFYKYSLHAYPETEIHINLEYSNSLSIRSLLNLFSLAETLKNKGKKVIIYWYYYNDDTNTLEQGQILQELLNITIDFVKLPFTHHKSGISYHP